MKIPFIESILKINSNDILFNIIEKIKKILKNNHKY